VPELLSVVIPTHNRPERLAVAVRSVLDQDYRSIEVVVVDDGSTPETADMLDRLSSADDRMIVRRHDRSKGASAARNTGMAAASGELISFCDDDDVWLPGAAEAAVEALHPAMGMVYGHHQVLIEDTGRLVTFRPPDVATAALMRWIYVPANPFVMARRANVDAELHFDTELITSEDWDMWLRCCELAPMTMVATPLYRYVQHRDERVTSTISAFADGHERFLAKHRSSMTSACIAHHELAIALTTHDWKAATDQVGLLPSHPANLGSAAILAGEVVGSRFGQRRGDPGLPLRWVARALVRATGADDHRTVT
jgi:glycosyltransferase involved in cell wall biosynthesis